MLDESNRAFLATLAASGLPPLHELTPEQARAAGAELAARPVERPEMARVQDVELDGPRARVLVPRESARGVIVYYHGGGWVTGGIESYDTLGRRLAARTGCAVVLVGYRLAPEHRYPPPCRTRGRPCAGPPTTWRRSPAPGPAHRRRRQRGRLPGRGHGAAGA